MQVGAQEHAKIIKAFGVPEGTKELQAYITSVGDRVAVHTERPEVDYKFYLLDDPMVNAFALPGGYIYVTRGLVAQANSEAELAAVLGHEIGHVTGRHSAERYSRGVVTSLGTMVLSAALDNASASQALGVGSNLFMKSYSRTQEHEADTLGIRYLARSGYNPRAMAAFLTALEAQTELERRIAGQGGSGQVPNWFSTHPVTGDRIQKTIAEAAAQQTSGEIKRDEYLRMLDGLIYGDSPKQGFVRGRDFYHTQMNFTFSVPPGFRMINQPDKIVASDGNGSIILFDAAGNRDNLDPYSYLTQVWLDSQSLSDAERIEINGKSAATASFSGTVNNQPVTIRLVAVRWSADTFFRFQLAVPRNAASALVEDMKRTTYSLRRLTAQEKKDIKPHRIRIVTAQAGDTVAALARRMPFDTYQEERFRALNALPPGQGLQAGQKYKIISAR